MRILHQMCTNVVLAALSCKTSKFICGLDRTHLVPQISANNMYYCVPNKILCCFQELYYHVLAHPIQSLLDPQWCPNHITKQLHKLPCAKCIIYVDTSCFVIQIKKEEKCIHAL